MMTSPRLPLGWIEDAVVVRIHPVELRRRAPRRPLFGTMDILLLSQGTGPRGRPAR
jgi:hypothetical protein